MGLKRLFSLLILTFGLSAVANFSFAQTHENAENATAEVAEHGHEEKKGIDIKELVFGHVGDSHEWHLFSLHGANGEHKEVALPLPCIIYRPEKGFTIFPYSKLSEGWYRDEAGNQISEHTYENLYVEKNMKEKIKDEFGGKVYDFSITKNVLSMIISVVLLLWLVLSAAKKYKNAMVAPSGFQNALETVIVFIRDEVAKPNLGAKYMRFMPLMLTIFFFIWINNLLGLLPGGANFTGNIAVTGCLALITFIAMMASSNKYFWSHLLNPPDVPFGVKILLVLIELISLLIKPVALMIRLFANILAGHIVILCVISLIFVFALMSAYVGSGFVVVSLAFSIFMFFLELLVAAIQAFIFTNLTAVFIGQSIEEHHHDEHEHVAVSESVSAKH